MMAARGRLAGDYPLRKEVDKEMKKLRATAGDVRLAAWENKTGTNALVKIGGGGYGSVYRQPVDNPEASTRAACFICP